MYLLISYIIEKEKRKFIEEKVNVNIDVIIYDGIDQ